jgi:hypothetical protein
MTRGGVNDAHALRLAFRKSWPYVRPPVPDLDARILELDRRIAADMQERAMLLAQSNPPQEEA